MQLFRGVDRLVCVGSRSYDRVRGIIEFARAGVARSVNTGTFPVSIRLPLVSGLGLIRQPAVGESWRPTAFMGQSLHGLHIANCNVCCYTGDMRVLQGIKPQDVLVLLKLCLWSERPWRHLDLGVELGLSQTEISFSLERCRASGLLDSEKRRVLRAALLEFLKHGLKYVYPAQPGAVCRGMPTSHSSLPLSKRIVSDEDDQYVWPWAEGKVRGQAISPLYESVPLAAEKDPQLHELLALVDALRVGRARERAIAAEELESRIGPKRA